MTNIGFNIDDYRKDAQRRQELAAEMDLKREANNIAKENVTVARKAFWVSVAATGISLVALAVALIK